MHVIMVEPAFPTNQREFVRALKSVGATVSAIGERPYHALDGQLKEWLTWYEQVPTVCDLRLMVQATRRLQRRGWIDRMEATVEAHMRTAAEAREHCRIPGTSVDTTLKCRDKPLMKQVLREAGIPCARSGGVSNAAEVRAFVAEVGYPVILKPRDGAGAQGAYKIESEADLERALAETGLSSGEVPYAIEEFISGHEGFYDTITVEGRVVHEFVTHYYPNVLHAMRTRWISPQFVATNRIDAPGYAELRRLGRRVIEVLGIRTAPTHMEWFITPKGLMFSEIACRPPGVGAWDLYCAANEMDLYAEWARAICGLPPRDFPSRRYAAGLIALRPDRDGTIVGTEGQRALFEDLGSFVIGAHFPAPGTPTQPVEAGYKANAWVQMRHPDYDTLRAMLDLVGRKLQVRAR
ncbi:MAG: ATP-grasp domain-containing protein [Planctomycetota bacterium]|nr:MAG: ATP-grasp domain-containing protein [Planctomycetota bacterium]